jgi:hypothetical protein
VAVDRFGRLLVTSYDTGKVLVYGIDDWVVPPPDTVPATVTVHPRTLNIRSRGHSVTVYVEIPGRDPSEIVAEEAEVLVADRRIPAEPKRRPVGDHDADGVPDLALKVPRRALIEALGTPGLHEIVLSAPLASGEIIEGTAEVVLTARGSSHDR